MTTNASTPGPWHVSDKDCRGAHAERIYKVCGESGGLIADVSAWWVDTWTARENARLIAAAPEMLTVLRAYLKTATDRDPNKDLTECDARARDLLTRLDGALSQKSAE